MTLVERKTGFVVIGKLARRAAADLNARLEALVRRQPHAVRTMTADIGTEFHGDKALEARVRAAQDRLRHTASLMGARFQ